MVQTDFLTMKTLLTLFCFLATQIAFAQTNPNHVYVSPHTRSNGTYVPGHYRTAPNSTNRDNFSTLGNTNPYTGNPGYILPDNKPLIQNYTYPSGSPNSNFSNSLDAVNDDAFLRSLNEKIKREEDSRRLTTELMNQNSSPQHNPYTNMSSSQAIALLEAVSFHDRYNSEAKYLIEKALSDLNYEVGVVDGIIDTQTILGIKYFQKLNRLKPDGRIGGNTAKYLGLRIYGSY